jgi:cell wall-associated NlpC family hydrolase
MQESLQTALDELLAAGGHARRHDFARLGADGSGPFLQATNAALLRQAASRLKAAPGGKALRTVQLPGPELRDKVAWTTASVAEVRAEPAHSAEQVTQALQGEVLTPLLHEDGWVLARLPDRYVGWVRDWHVQLVPAAAPPAFAAGTAARIAAEIVTLRVAPGGESEACGETVLGTAVRVGAEESGWVEVWLPGGRRGFVPAEAVRSGTGPWPRETASLVATLGRFIGVPYLWGGRSPKGFDCSGLVQFVFGLHGVSLPRDSDEQAECGEPVETPAAGDLLFFGRDRVTHVGVATGPDTFVHARGEVRRNALRAGSPGYDDELCRIRLGTRRIGVPRAPA